MYKVKFRYAIQNDVPLLAKMNQQLIGDEGHRNKLTLGELNQRMSSWLDSNYTAILFLLKDEAVGYALYWQESDGVYLRQLFVKESSRRKGIGRQALEWLKENPWKSIDKVRVEVLTQNQAAFAFWKSAGFNEYCTTLELLR